MTSGSVDHVAVVVSDIDAAAAELKRLFDVDMHIVDVPAIGCRVAFCDEGFELVQPLAAGTDADDLQSAWSGALASVGIKVDDIEQARATMAASGRVPTSEIETPGGVLELFYADGFAGIPVTLTAHGDQGFATAIGATSGEPYVPRIVPAG